MTGETKQRCHIELGTPNKIIALLHDCNFHGKTSNKEQFSEGQESYGNSGRFLSEMLKYSVVATR